MPSAPKGAETSTSGHHISTIWVMARRQTLVQLTDELLDALDRHRASTGRSRSEVIREAVKHHLAADGEAEIDRAIVEAYTRNPARDVWGEEAARRLIEAEPW